MWVKNEDNRLYFKLNILKINNLKYIFAFKFDF